MTTTPSVDILIQQAQLAEREARRDDARSLYERALYSLKRSQDGGFASALVRWVARTYQLDADLDAALDCVEAAIAIAELAGDLGALGHAINIQAIVHWQQGELEEAEELYQKAREHAVAAGETRLAAMTAQNLGIIANIRGDLEKTLRYYRTSLAEFRTLGAPKEVCSALNNMGMLCTDLARWDDGSKSFDEAVQIATALGDLPARVLIEVNRAELHIARGEFPAARAACEFALTLSSQTQDRCSMGDIEKHLGTIARELGEFGRAEEHLERAQSIARERRDLLLSADTAREHAELCRRQGRHRDALLHLNRGHRLFSQLSAKRDLADLNRRSAKLESHFLEVVRHWSGSIESKDRYTQGHCERVADLACSLAMRAGLDQRELFWFRVGAMVHDVGKLIIPSEVLNKPGKLAPDEWELVKRHPLAGVEMLADMDFPGDVIPMVRSHHERWDGLGYPDGLAGDAIPRSARILCIADVYDALTSRRSYKASLSHDAAMEIMRSDVGKQFDAELFALFETMMRVRQPSLRARQVAEARQHDRPTLVDLTVNGPTDDLTGLLTRKPFVEAANRLLHSRGTFSTVALLVIDVDEFKQVNDTHGHLQGDAVLRVIAGTLREIAGSAGIVGRYAGDEFVVLLPQSQLSDARDLAERIRTTVRRASIPLRERAGSMSVTLSLGVGFASPEHEVFEQLFAVADGALYEAKRRGRDAVVCSSELSESVREPTANLKQFVGREDELRKLTRLLESSVDAGPNVVAVVGEAGVGKSTLVRQLETEVRLRAGMLVGGCCIEADAKPPYAPWAEVICALHQQGVVGHHDWRELRRLVPGLGDVASDQVGNKYALFDEIVTYLRLATAARPVVIVLDDMQWADSATWDVLEHLLSQLDHERMLICLTLRAEDLRGLALDRRNRLVRDERFHEVSLPRLTEPQLDRWLAGVFGGQEASRDLLAFLQSYSEGNPLLATQLLRMLLDDGAVRYDNGRWGIRADQEVHLPPALTGLMERRLDRLSDKTRRILNTAAVIGRVFDVDLVMASGAGEEEELLDAIDEATDHSVIDVWNNGTGSTFSFTHALLVDTVLRGINPRRLGRIHERVAHAMEKRSPGSVAEIAVHFDRAGLAPEAYRYSMAAGSSALGVYAVAEARRFFEVAERTAGGSDERAMALHRLAEVAETEGMYALSEELCDRALATLDGQPASRTQLALRRIRERTRALQGQPLGETIEACHTLLDAARALHARDEEAALLNMISQYQSRGGEWREAEETARAAVQAAEEAESPRLLAETLTRLGMSMMDRSADDSAGFYNRALELFRELGDRCGEARCNINLGIIHQRQGDPTGAEAAYDRALEAARSAHAVDLAALASLNLGVLYLRRGQRELSSESFDAALDGFTAVGNEAHRVATLYNIAHLAREGEDWAAACAVYEQVASIASRIGQPDLELGARAGRALASLAIGDRGLAEEAMRWIRANVEPRPEWWFQGRDLVDALRVRLAADRGDEAHALRILTEAVEVARKHDRYAAAYLLAESAHALRRTPEALLSLVDSILPEIETLGFSGVASRLTQIKIGLNASQAA